MLSVVRDDLCEMFSKSIEMFEEIIAIHGCHEFIRNCELRRTIFRINHFNESKSRLMLR